MVRDALECVEHLHEKGLSHGDIKMNNIVRIGDELRLIDLDAVAKLDMSAFARSIIVWYRAS